MPTAVNRLTNANIYINGNNLLGKAEEVTLPVVKHKMAEHKALGMVGSVEFPTGVDKLEAKIKWNSFYQDVMKQVANPFASLQIQVRASLESYTAAGRASEVPVVVHMTASAKDFPMGNFKQHENVEAETNLNVTYVKMEIGGQQIMEIDVLANIFKVDGTDILTNYRLNTGA